MITSYIVDTYAAEISIQKENKDEYSLEIENHDTDQKFFIKLNREDFMEFFNILKSFIDTIKEEQSIK